MSVERPSRTERVAARIVTGPLAFLASGLIDLTVFTSYALRGAVNARIAGRRGDRSHTASDASTI